MKKIFFSVLLASSVFADGALSEGDLTAKITGNFDVQYGYLKQTLPAGSKITGLQKDRAINTSGNLAVRVENEVSEDFKYGANLGVKITSDNDRLTPSTLFVSTQAGKLELGSGKSAFSQMKITGYSIGAATQGGWDVWSEQNPQNLTGTDGNPLSYITAFPNFLDSKTRSSGKVEFSRKVSYFSPNLSGFQFGISYVPDSTNAGYTSLDKPVVHKINDVKDGIAAGISYENMFGDKRSFKISLVGERGKSGAHMLLDETTKQPMAKKKLKDLNSYMIGSKVQIEDFSVAGSYADYMKSFSSDDIVDSKKKAFAYSLGAAYKFEKVNTSVTYYKSKYKNNNVEALSFETSYNLAPGLMPYFEVTHYKNSGKYVTNGGVKTDKRNGTLFLAGTKIVF